MLMGRGSIVSEYPHDSEFRWQLKPGGVPMTQQHRSGREQAGLSSWDPFLWLCLCSFIMHALCSFSGFSLMISIKSFPVVIASWHVCVLPSWARCYPPEPGVTGRYRVCFCVTVSTFWSQHLAHSGWSVHTWLNQVALQNEQHGIETCYTVKWDLRIAFESNRARSSVTY